MEFIFSDRHRVPLTPTSLFAFKNNIIKEEKEKERKISLDTGYRTPELYDKGWSRWETNGIYMCENI